MTRSALVLGVVLVLGGCGGGGSDATADSVADDLGCALRVDPVDERKLFVARSGACLAGGSTPVHVYEFATAEAAGNYWDIAEEFGSARDDAVQVGNVWVVPDDPARVATVRDILDA